MDIKVNNENIYSNITETHDFVKFSLQLFESKSLMIMSELEKIKNLFKTILTKGKNI
jgi:hypothetical protein